MKKMKKLVSILLCAAMMVGISSCGEKEEGGSGEVQTLTWIVPGDTPEDLPVVLEKVNEITVEKIGAKVDLQFIDLGAYQEKMNTYMATSKEYDLAFAGAYLPLVSSASKGGIMSLEKLLETTPALKESLPDFVWELTKYQGEIYGVPNYQVLPMVYCVNFFNEYLKEIGGFDPYSFKKLDDLEPYLEAAKKYFEEKGIDNGYAISPLRKNVMPLVFGYADEYDKVDNILFKKQEDGTYKGTIMWEAPEYIQGVEKLYDWYKEGYIRPDIVSSEGDSHGKAAVTFAIYKPGVETQYKGQGLDLSCQLIQKPVIDNCAAMTVIGKDCKNPELAIKLIELVNTDKELFNLITLGIEGTHYEKTGENTFRYIGTRQENKYFINAGWKFGNQFNEYVQEGSDPDVWEQTIEYNNSAELNPLAGFSVDNTSIRTVLAQIETVVSSYSVINVGAADPAEYYDEFLQKLKAAGSDKVVAEYERQINEFIKTK